jgi:DNA-binding transcriptional LysR family regulator
MPQAKIRRYFKHGTMHQLSVFEAVARLGSYTRAAEELHIAQPTASVQMRKLTGNDRPAAPRAGRQSYPPHRAGREVRAACREIFRARPDRGQALQRAASNPGACGSLPAPRQVFLPAHPRRVRAAAPRYQRLVTDPQSRDAAEAARRRRGRPLHIRRSARAVEVVVQRILPNPMVVLARPDRARRANTIALRRPGGGAHSSCASPVPAPARLFWKSSPATACSRGSEWSSRPTRRSGKPLTRRPGRVHPAALHVRPGGRSRTGSWRSGQKGYRWSDTCISAPDRQKQLPRPRASFMEFTREHVQRHFARQSPPPGAARAAVT